MYKLLFEPLHELKEYGELLALTRAEPGKRPPRRTVELVGLSDSQRAHVLAALSRDTGRPLLVVAPNQLAAEHLLSDLGRLLEREAALLPAR